MAENAKLQNKLATLVAETYTAFTMAVTSVGTSATKVPATAKAGRKAVLVQNKDSAATVYLGASTVTADDTATGGFELGAGVSILLHLDGSVDLYAIASATTTPVGTMEFAD